MCQKMVFPCTSLCVSLHTPGREMATCIHGTWLHHPPNMPVNNPAKIQGIWAAGMYLCLCPSQTRSDVSADLGSNGRWYFRGTIKQLESLESNYDFEPATLDFHPIPMKPPQARCPLPHHSMAGLFIPLSLTSLLSLPLNPPRPTSLCWWSWLWWSSRGRMYDSPAIEPGACPSTSCFQERPLSSPLDICFTRWGCKSKGASLKIVTTWKLRAMFYLAEIFRT